MVREEGSVSKGGGGGGEGRESGTNVAGEGETIDGEWDEIHRLRRRRWSECVSLRPDVGRRRDDECGSAHLVMQLFPLRDGLCREPLTSRSVLTRVGHRAHKELGGQEREDDPSETALPFPSRQVRILTPDTLC